jgi:hypothetical protein
VEVTAKSAKQGETRYGGSPDSARRPGHLSAFSPVRREELSGQGDQFGNAEVMEKWCSPGPEETSRLLAGVDVPWWFAGGWAIELFLGRAHRGHSDLDLGCFRKDVGAILDYRVDWDFRVPISGELRQLEPGALDDAAIHSLWCRPTKSACWVLEILFEEGDGEEWVYRRDGRIRRSARDIVGHTIAGLRYLRPEIQLLYKSKNSRPPDNDDFAAAWPRLDRSAKDWLMTMIEITAPGHAWLDVERAGGL